MQSTDTEVLLSCPTVVPVSDEEVEIENSDDDLDLSGDETVDSDNEAFVDSPRRIGKKYKSRDLRLKGVKSVYGHHLEEAEEKL